MKFDSPTSSMLAAFVLGSTVFAQGSYVNFESPQTNPLRVSADGTRLFAANTADNRLSVFDLSSAANPARIAEIAVGLEPVSVHPRNNDEVWVVNHVSDSISVVSVSQGLVLDTIQVKDEPCDVVFAGAPLRAFVSASRSNQVRVFDLTTHAQVASIALNGMNPRALAVSADGTRVYAAFALSGNRTTVVPRNVAPPQGPPTNPALPAPPQVALIIDATDPAWSPGTINYTVLDHDVVEINANTSAVVRYFDRAGTTHLGLAVRPGASELWVANTDSRNLVRFETALRGHLVDNRVTRITLGATPVVTAFDLNPGLDYATLPNASALSTALSQPAGVVFDPTGAFLYVASFGTDRVGKLDAGGNVVARIQIGPVSGTSANSRDARGPRGLAMHPSGTHLYVQNRVSNTISIVDLSSASETSEIGVGGYDPTPTVIRDGRGFLYDAKLSGNGTNSCASCHIDAQSDQLAWDLGNPGGDMVTVTDPQTGAVFQQHPMKGPMVTQPLAGLAGLAPFHWRGDKADLNAFNVAFEALMGGSQISTTDMQAFVDFQNTIAFAANPNQNLDRSLPTNVAGFNPVTGAAQFTQNPSPLGGPACGSCHSSPNALLPRVAPNPPDQFVAKVPFLRDFYRRWLFFRTSPGAQNLQGFGFDHDGALDEISAFPQINNMRAFFASFDTGTAPTVGYSRTVTSANASSASITTDVATLSARAAAGDCDIVGHGVLDGVLRGLAYDVATSRFRVDRTGVGPYAWTELQTKALAGSTFTLMGVPFGSGARIGLDRDLDGILDGDEGASAGVPYCFGDGSALACPCGNASAVGAQSGCLNSLGLAGRLVASGTASISADSIVLLGSGMPNSSALYFQGSAQQNGGLGIAFGDGLRCAGGAVMRLGTKINAANSSSYPQSGDPSVSVKGGVTSAGTFHYQTWYRNAAPFCTPATFNLTNGVSIAWGI